MFGHFPKRESGASLKMSHDLSGCQTAWLSAQNDVHFWLLKGGTYIYIYIHAYATMHKYILYIQTYIYIYVYIYIYMHIRIYVRRSVEGTL